MSIRQLFRPGPGNRIEEFTAGYLSETCYPGSWMCMNTLIPTSQGVSGVLGGGTLGGADFIEVVKAAADVAGAEAMMVGCLRGTSINSVKDWTNTSADVMADGDLGIIQTWGVHPGAWITDAGTLGDGIHIHATQEGEAVAATATATDDCGAALGTGFSVTQGDAQHGVVAWVRRA